jgi:hypothetical protein
MAADFAQELQPYYEHFKKYVEIAGSHIEKY